MPQRTTPWLFTSPALDELHRQWDTPGRDDADQQRATCDLAAGILQARVGTRVGALVIASAGWSKERADHADKAAEPGTPEWREALGTREHATLTADGEGVAPRGWCTCPTRASQWIYYERWTGRGREAHGWVHSTCRRLTQTG